MNSTFRRMVRRRTESPLRLRFGKQHATPRPVMDALNDAVPSEIIDLATGPFQKRFPDLARDRRKLR